MNIRTAALSLMCAALLAGCGTAPLSVLENRPFHRTHLHREPLTIVSVNGQYSPERTRLVFPGMNTLVLEARPVGGMSIPKQQTVSFEVEPCTKYYLAAERENSLSQKWTLVVDRKESVAGCSPEEELAKAKREGIPPGRIASSPKTGSTQ
jgi:hypothetical protein